MIVNNQIILKYVEYANAHNKDFTRYSMLDSMYNELLEVIELVNNEDDTIDMLDILSNTKGKYRDGTCIITIGDNIESLMKHERIDN